MQYWPVGYFIAGGLTSFHEFPNLPLKKMKAAEANKLLQHPFINDSAPTAWADLGCGTGFFTDALAGLLAPGSTIYAVDRDGEALKSIASSHAVTIQTIQADFTNDELALPSLDWILMANSMHYAKDQLSLIKKLRHYLAPGGYFLLVEYDMDTPNPWVPYPLSFESLQLLAAKAGYHSVHKIGEVPSIYNRSKIYSAFINIK